MMAALNLRQSAFLMIFLLGAGCNSSTKGTGKDSKSDSVLVEQSQKDLSSSKENLSNEVTKVSKVQAGSLKTTVNSPSSNAPSTACSGNSAAKFNLIDLKKDPAIWNKDGAAMRSYCNSIGVPVPDSDKLEGLFSFQGDYSRIAPKGADELICRLAKFKAVYLTNAFWTLNEVSNLAPLDPENGCKKRTASENRFSQTDPYLLTKYGKSHLDANAPLSFAYQDAEGRGLFYVISKLRHIHNDKIQIYGYVGATIDNPNGTWSNLTPAQNYLCPAGICTDFINYVEKWRGMELAWANTYLDGFFLDMANEFYVNSITLANQASYLHSLTSVSGRPYKIIFNTLDTGRPYFYPRGNGNAQVVQSAQRQIPWVSQFTRPGDSIFIEGFYLKAGSQLGDLDCAPEVGQLRDRV